jgi:biotin--protein ligase
MKVLIYADEGVSSFSLQETLKTFRIRYANVEMVDHELLRSSDWEKEASLIIIPGGRDIPYHRKLKGKAVSKIRNFVEEGGSFLGICAGAYFASAEVIFEKGTPLEIHEKRDLSFFSGAAVGTLYPHSPFVYESEKSSHSSSVTFKGEELSLYYNGGCTFEDTEKYPNVTVLARYHDAADQPAIIHCRVGKGNAVLSGVHFEVNPENLKKEGCEQKMIDRLKSSDPKREHLITFLMSLLNS